MVDDKTPPQELVDFMAIIAQEQDPKMRTILSMVFGLFARLEKKFDSVLRDEQALRDVVLNGHAPVHASDHDYIALTVRPIIPRIAKALDWVEERQKNNGLCQWAMDKIAEEEAVEQIEATAKVKAKWDIKTAAITALISIVSTAVGFWVLAHL